MNVTLCWLGKNDIDLSSENGLSGPIAAYLNSKFVQSANKIYILSSFSATENLKYKMLLNNPRIEIFPTTLVNPTNYTEIYKNVTATINKIRESHPESITWSFFISSGTSQMTSIWILLSQTEYKAELYQTELDESGSYHIKKPMIPFTIKTEYISDFLKNQDKIPEDNWLNLPFFPDIIHQSDIMKKILNQVYLTAIHDVPALILGETGTGKELLAQAIHANSSRKYNKFMIINCGALPESIIESIFFGHSKGAFTGALHETKGVFENTNKGTLFLDEIGELSPVLQVKLLRVLETGIIQRVGDMKEIKTDVRIIAATNRDIYKMIRQNKFREDLYYRISGSVITVPPLRNREEDASHIARHFLETINTGLKEKGATFYEKKLDASAYLFIKKYNWPGNIRELYHTIHRAILFCGNECITGEHLKTLTCNTTQRKKMLTFPINLEEKLNDIRKKYIMKALDLSNGNKTRAAGMLGYKNYQNLDYCISKKGIKHSDKKNQAE